jgi:hypothetical protein
MKTLILCLLIFPQDVTYVRVGPEPTREAIRLREKFEEWRRTTLLVLDGHMKEDPNCIYRHMRETLRTIHFNYGSFDERKRMIGSPGNNVEFPNIVINNGVQWSERNAVEDLLHEIAHFSKVPGKKGFICGDDYRPSGFTVCILFNRRVTSSSELSSVVREHFGRELNALDKEILR